jgi:hypothetical protein
MFRLPCLLDPQVAPTAMAFQPQGSRAVYSTQWTWSYPQELWYRYVPESGNWHGGTFTHWTMALSAATHAPDQNPLVASELTLYDKSL